MLWCLVAKKSKSWWASWMRRSGSDWLYRWDREHWTREIKAGAKHVRTALCFRWRFSAWRNTCGNEAIPSVLGPPGWRRQRWWQWHMVALRGAAARPAQTVSRLWTLFLHPFARNHVSFPVGVQIWIKCFVLCGFYMIFVLHSNH